MKTCTKCGKEKALNEYYRDKQKSSGYRPDCKTCNNEKSMAYAKANPEKRKDYCTKYKTGLSSEEYNEMLKEQNHSCAICKTVVSGDRRLSVDHCHDTMYIRALLCQKCNAAIGLLNDSIDLLNSAIAYLQVDYSIKNLKHRI